jgi:hypothetical protein
MKTYATRIAEMGVPTCLGNVLNSPVNREAMLARSKDQSFDVESGKLADVAIGGFHSFNS